MEMIVANYPEHNRDCFFKYTSASTAVKILESSAVLYRSPIQFNDPFDVQSGLHFDFDIGSLPDKILGHIERLVSLDTKPDVPRTEPFGELVTRMWEMKATHGFPRGKLREIARPLLVLLKEKTIDFQQQYQQTWWNEFLPRLRVFCVSEVKDNLLMWSHYSNEHTGVVFEFRVLPEQDNPLCAAKSVQYCNVPPAFFSEGEWLDDFFGVRELDTTNFYFRYAYVKSEIWAYEKEWRVWDLKASAEQGNLCSSYPLRPNEIGAVYLGCRINPAIRATIMRLLSIHPNAKAFQARKAPDAFRLDFDPI
jgi:Protein of unknown function (DUF2971)